MASIAPITQPITEVQFMDYTQVRKTVLITGAAGFFGSHFVEHVLRNTDWNVVAMVRMGKVGALDRLHDPDVSRIAWEQGRLQTVWHDFRDSITPYVADQIGEVNYIVHAGGETHVDRSISDPLPFIQSNVIGTYNMLEYARNYLDLEWFNYFSTDEVYGPAPEGVLHREDFPYNATNPYSATKAGAEQLVNAFGNTYSVPVFTTNTMNLIGEKQHAEKFIPKIIQAVLSGDKLYIHANSDKTKAGSRFYLHCRNAAAAILFLLRCAEQRGRYNVVGDTEVDNLELAQTVAGITNDYLETDLPLVYELVDFHGSRPGHDLRYALDGSKLRSMGFEYPLSLDASLRKTVQWTLDNRQWLK